MLYSRNKPVKQSGNKPRRWLWIVLGVVGIGVLTIALLELTNSTYLLHSKPVARTSTIPTTNQQTTPTDTSDKTDADPVTPAPVAPSDNKGTSDDTSAEPTTSGVAPDIPSGTFISNHSPNLSGTPFPSEVQSVCTTSPGASCSIKFTKGNLTRTLPAQTTNSDGNTFWTWDVKQAGFTEGTWTVTVIATQNKQSATATDTLKVGP